MPVQLTLWPMPIPVIQLEDRNGWLKDSGVCEMCIDDLKSYHHELVHDGKLCHDMDWIDELQEAIDFVANLIKRNVKIMSNILD